MTILLRYYNTEILVFSGNKILKAKTTDFIQFMVIISVSQGSWTNLLSSRLKFHGFNP
jgi:hypothetical protein